MQEVSGSIPLGSTKNLAKTRCAIRQHIPRICERIPLPEIDPISDAAYNAPIPV